jgi:membrane protein implicated in regulation of membrane protease activity
MAAIVRGLIVAGGIILMVLGLVAIISFPDARLVGLWWVAGGAFLVVVVAAERQRYRSAAAERSNAQPGPGGGERPGEAIEPRFRPTSEVFIDPTSGHHMRVLVDPDTGERRYVAES